MFRDAHDLGLSDLVVVFSDDEIECAAVIRLFLQLVTCGTLTFEKELPHIKALCLFLNKWDCAAARANLLSLLKTAVHSGRSISPSQAFIVAANADSLETCSLILTLKNSSKCRGKDGSKSTSLPTVGKCVWDPAHWGLAFWNDVPKKYLFALARAYGEVDGPQYGERPSLPWDFEKYFKLVPNA